MRSMNVLVAVALAACACCMGSDAAVTVTGPAKLTPLERISTEGRATFLMIRDLRAHLVASLRALPPNRFTVGEDVWRSYKITVEYMKKHIKDLEGFTEDMGTLALNCLYKDFKPDPLEHTQELAQGVWEGGDANKKAQPGTPGGQLEEAMTNAMKPNKECQRFVDQCWKLAKADFKNKPLIFWSGGGAMNAGCIDAGVGKGMSLEFSRAGRSLNLLNEAGAKNGVQTNHKDTDNFIRNTPRWWFMRHLFQEWSHRFGEVVGDRAASNPNQNIELSTFLGLSNGGLKDQCGSPGNPGPIFHSTFHTATILCGTEMCRWYTAANALKKGKIVVNFVLLDNAPKGCTRLRQNAAQTKKKPGIPISNAVEDCSALQKNLDDLCTEQKKKHICGKCPGWKPKGQAKNGELEYTCKLVDYATIDPSPHPKENACHGTEVDTSHNEPTQTAKAGKHGKVTVNELMDHWKELDDSAAAAQEERKRREKKWQAKNKKHT